MGAPANFPQFGFVPPNKIWSRGAAVTGTVSDSKHNLSWLTDGKGKYPMRVNTGTSAHVITNTAGTVSVAALHSHRIKVNAVLSGGVSGTILPAATEPHDILFDPYVRITPVAGVTSVTLTITGNTEDNVIGELILGELDTLPMPKWDSEFYDYNDFSNPDYPGSLIGVQEYDEGEESDTVGGAQIYTQAQLDKFMAWRKTQRTFSLPSLLIPDLSKNRSMYGFMSFTWTNHETPGEFVVTFKFKECPRSRW